MRGLEYLIAQRYGKGRAANKSETKPPNLDKKLSFKTANGRRVPLTDLLGQQEQPKPNHHPPKRFDLPRYAANTQPGDEQTFTQRAQDHRSPAAPPEKAGNNQQAAKTQQQNPPPDCQTTRATQQTENQRIHQNRQTPRAGRRQSQKHTTPAVTKA